MISVVISTADRADSLARCLASLVAGSVLPDEVIVVDQSRGGETAAVVAAADQRLDARRVAMSGRGLGRSQNLGVREATREVVAVLDDDCVAAHDWIATIRARFGDAAAGGTSPGASGALRLDAVAGRVLALPAEGERTAPVSLRESDRPREFSGRVLPWLVGSGNNFAVRRDRFLAIGGCDERLGPGSPGQGGVDMDLFYRLVRSGAVVRYDPTMVVHHERDTPAARRARRPMYGHGVGAMAAFRLREGDWYMVPMLARWTGLRAGRAVGAIVRGDGTRLGEEWLMLRGTVAGLVHGFTRAASAGENPNAGENQ